MREGVCDGMLRAGAIILGSVVALNSLGGGGALGQAESEGTFAHKTITVYIGNTAGGTYDLYGRLVVRHLGRFLPGTPTLIAENMPGAGTLRAANYVYRVAPKDGTALGLVTEAVALEQALLNSAVQYDARRFTWIGGIADQQHRALMWHTSKVQSIADARRYETTVAGTGAGNPAETVPTLLNAVAGTRFRIVKGYTAANEALLAMERGEVEGAAANWATIKSAKSQWLKDHSIRIILQDLPERGSDLPDVPTLAEVGETAEARQLLGLYASTGAIGRAIFAPPGLASLFT